jgi:hypothetical protein
MNLSLLFIEMQKIRGTDHFSLLNREPFPCKLEPSSWTVSGTACMDCVPVQRIVGVVKEAASGLMTHCTSQGQRMPPVDRKDKDLGTQHCPKHT